MKRETQTREKRIHRENMHLYVFEPSRDYAFARFITGIGYGLLAASVVCLSYFIPFAVIVLAVALGCILAGWGWTQMLDERLDRYHDDIMARTTVEETTVMENEEPKLAPRVITNGSGDIMAEFATVGKLDARQWRDVAFALRVHKLTISQKVLARAKETRIMSQSQYKWWYDHMVTEHLMTTEPNELTQAGMDKLDTILAPYRSENN